MAELTYDELMEWQRRFDPNNFNKARGAQYHTAPTVILPGDQDYPKDANDGSVTIMFRLSDECWISGEPEKVVVDAPLFIEKEPRKGAKHGPVFILGTDAVFCAIPYKENYYWSAQVLSEHLVKRVEFRPGKKRTDGKKREVVVVATFIP